jgi:hypothetical protein
MSMISARRCVAVVVLAVVLGLGIATGALFPGVWPFARAAPAAPGNAAAPSGPAGVPPAKKTAEGLANEWAFVVDPGKKKTLTASGSEAFKSGEGLMAVSYRIQAPGKAKEWFALAVQFYTEKCGSDQGPVETISAGKHVCGLNGASKRKGRYLITEPAVFSTPIGELQSRPADFMLLAHHDADSTVTVVVKQQGEDVVLIALTAAVR